MPRFSHATLLLTAAIVAHLLPTHVLAQTSADWYMAGANPQRTSWVTTTPSNLTGIEWYRPIEAYIDQKTQIVVGNQHAYVATAKGLIALNAENGELAWQFNTELPVSTPTIIGTSVYFASFDRKVYKLTDNGNSYSNVQSFIASGSLDANPLVIDNIVYIGDHDGFFYALNGTNLTQQWKYPTGVVSDLGPIMISPAYDVSARQLHFVASNQYAYALNTNGTLAWKSPQKLNGERYTSWWPVIFDNYVIYSSSQALRNEQNPGTWSIINPSNMKGVFRDSFFGSTSGTGNIGASVTSNESMHGWPNGYNLIDTQTANNSNNMSIQRFYNEYPYLKSYIVLNKSNGQENELMPHIYTGTYSGPVNPPIVNPNNNAVYAKSMTDAGGHIPRGSVIGWKPGNRYLHRYEGGNWAFDEPQGYSGAGTSIFFNLCCDRASGYLSGTRWWNYGTGILEHVLPSINDANAYDIMWRKYGNALERLQSYYKGNSNNRFGNGPSGSRNGVYNSHGLQNPPIPYRFTNSSGQTINRAFTHRSNAIIAIGSSNNQSGKTLVTIATPSTSETATGYSNGELVTKLEHEIQKILDADGFLAPGYYNHGNKIPDAINGGSTLNVYFDDPAETLAALSQAYEYVSNSSLRQQLATYIQEYYTHYFGGSQPIGTVGWNNDPRDNFNFPPPVQSVMNSSNDSTGSLSRLAFYAFWKYAEAFPSQAQTVYNQQASRMAFPIYPPQNLSLNSVPHVYNEYIAGYKGFVELCQMVSNCNTTLRNNVQSQLNTLLEDRVNGFSKDHPWYGENDNPGGMQQNNYSRRFNLSRNFHNITPVLGEYMRTHNTTLINNALNEYKYVGQLWFTCCTHVSFQEDVKHHLYDSPSLLQATAYIQGGSPRELSKYIDAPAFYRGDLFYIQNIVTALDADPNYISPTPGPTSSATPTPTPTTPQLPGDVDGNGTVGLPDYNMVISNFGLTSTNGNPLPRSQGDLDQNGTIDLQDFNQVISHFGQSS